MSRKYFENSTIKRCGPNRSLYDSATGITAVTYGCDPRVALWNGIDISIRHREKLRREAIKIFSY